MATYPSFPTADPSLFALLPVSGDAGASALTTSTRFGPFEAGWPVVVASTAAFHVLAGDDTVAATTSEPIFGAGVYSFIMPEGATYVAMIDSSAGAGTGQVYQG